ncbi:hypothetical protein [Streptomyces corynorhini]|uniref:Uncharacterized protein n=1 Tax=Streptomyces corynorhini TaxID=2282652 RepID=A0A370BGA0_9ACTN|nr:hypothetical protein [Streptomyces corynorhini]RDG38696.1 hypothetical protein DVH02_07860 [Streptomyces corynorhini]
MSDPHGAPTRPYRLPRPASSGPRARKAIAGWLSLTAKDPDIPLRDWKERRPAMLPTGRRFDAVKMHPNLVHAALGSTAADGVRAGLAAALDGPVICHPGVWYYALVPPQTTESWKSPHAAVLGRGAWLGVPRTEGVSRRVADPYWATPLESPDRLCVPDAVAVILHAGAVRLEDPARPHAHAWRSLLDHLTTCPSCTSGDLCDEGAVLRRAERAAR